MFAIYLTYAICFSPPHCRRATVLAASIIPATLLVVLGLTMVLSVSFDAIDATDVQVSVQWWRHDMRMIPVSLSLCEGNPLTEGRWCKALMFFVGFFIVSWTHCWTNSRVIYDLRRRDSHVMSLQCVGHWQPPYRYPMFNNINTSWITVALIMMYLRRTNTVSSYSSIIHLQRKNTGSAILCYSMRDCFNAVIKRMAYIICKSRPFISEAFEFLSKW